MPDNWMTQTRLSDGGQFSGPFTDIVSDGSHWTGMWHDHNNGTNRVVLIYIDKANLTGRVEEKGDHVDAQVWPGTLTIKANNHYVIDGRANGYDFGVNVILPDN